MQCLLCENRLDPLSYGLPTRLGKCAHCGSRPEDRELAWFLERYLRANLGEGSKVLEVWPKEAGRLARKRFLGLARYTAIDSRPHRITRSLEPPHRCLEMEVTRLAFSDHSFELVLCNGVFPFIRSDYQAMAQIHRCLKVNGVAILNVPHPLAKSQKAWEMTPENPLLYTDEYRLENGTEWLYGADYFERLEAAGFFHHSLPLLSLVNPKTASEQLFRPDAELILCFKFKDVMEKFVNQL